MAGKNRSAESTKGKKPITVRLDMEAYNLVKEIADENERSVSAQISHMIKKLLEGKNVGINKKEKPTGGREHRGPSSKVG